MEELKETLRVKARAYQESKKKLGELSSFPPPPPPSTTTTSQHSIRGKTLRGSDAAAAATRRGSAVASRSRARSESPSPLPSALSSPSFCSREHPNDQYDDFQDQIDDTSSYKDAFVGRRREARLSTGGVEKEIVALRIEAANRSAEIERLKKELASTLSLRPPSEGALERTRAKLSSCTADCASAVATANALIRKIVAELASLPSALGPKAVRSAPDAADGPSLRLSMDDLSHQIADLIRAFRVLQRQAPSSPSQSSPSSHGYQPRAALAPTNIAFGPVSSSLNPPSSSSRLLSALQLESTSNHRDLELNQSRREISDLKIALEHSKDATIKLQRESESRASEREVLMVQPSAPSANTLKLLEMIKGGIVSLHHVASGLESGQAHYPVPLPPDLKEAARKMAYESNALEAAFGLLEQEMKVKLSSHSSETQRGQPSSSALLDAKLYGDESDGSELSFGERERERERGRGRGEEEVRSAASRIVIPSFAPTQRPSPPPPPPPPSDAIAATSAASAVASASASLLAEKLHELKRRSEIEIESHRSRADKWKQRCEELGSKIALMSSSCVAKEAAVNERSQENERRLSDELGRSQAEILRLQASLSGALAARKELERAQVVASASSDSKGLEARHASAR